MPKLDKTIANILKVHGSGALFLLGKNEEIQKVDRISTGLSALDEAIGGGIPVGRVIEVYGPEAGGKTTLALMIVAQVQKLGGTAGYIDAEHSLDVQYAKALGVDIDNLLVSQPDNGEQGLEIAEKLIESNEVGIVVVDSVAALVPKSELEGDMGEPQMGLQARLMSQALRKLTAIVHKSRTILLFINQVRDKIGVIFGNPETTTGGRALKFYSAVRIDLRRMSSIKKSDNVIGQKVKIKIVKNKTFPPYKVLEVDCIFGKGFVNG